jgi:hypothetical protein
MTSLHDRLVRLWQHVNPFTPAGWASLVLAAFWVVLTLWIIDVL